MTEKNASANAIENSNANSSTDNKKDKYTTLDINLILCSELKIKDWQTENALALKSEGSTVPFIARYRKERTGELDETVLRELFDRFDYLTELEDRKQTILKSIDEQGKLTDELCAKIGKCLQKNELEDLYLPFKPKKRTRATIAKEKGLLPLADSIKAYNTIASPQIDLDRIASAYISVEKEVNSVAEALKGASDIIAEEISEIAALRAWTREHLLRYSSFSSSIKSEYPEGSTKYEMYRNFECPVADIASHNMLALRRGESEGILSLDMKFEESDVLSYFEKKQIFTKQENLHQFLSATIKDAFSRLMKNSLIGEVRLAKKLNADEESIRVFEENLRQLLLSSPAGMKPTIGFDPGFRTGCKVVALDSTGKFLEYRAIFPFQSDYEKRQAADVLVNMIKKYNIELIAIGNGTASRESDRFVTELISTLERKPVKIIVSESGASIYSASTVAIEEFPDLDVTVRGAISIGRRLMDPLAELVKIDPKSIGVGQYQHDVDQKLLKKKLEETVESSVNYVGVDLNTASKELLTYISGISSSIAKSIVDWRNENGAFRRRKDLMKVPRFGAKTFEQAAGFLRIRNGENELDNTAVHPESYHLVEQILKDLQTSVKLFSKTPEVFDKVNLGNYVSDSVGLPTLKDIINELKKPGRDPREQFKYAKFEDGVNEMSDLRIGMVLEGIVTNITNFGAFVEIGVHQDGLVHISEIANRFIKSPTEVLKVGQIVKVKVLEVNEALKRIALSIKQAAN